MTVYRGERYLADQVAAGEMTVEDGDAMRTFALFLAETPSGMASAGGRGASTHAGIVDLFPDRAAFEAWRSRWLGYALGLADGPTSAEEYAELLPRIRAERGPGERPG